MQPQVRPIENKEPCTPPRDLSSQPPSLPPIYKPESICNQTVVREGAYKFFDFRLQNIAGIGNEITFKVPASVSLADIFRAANASYRALGLNGADTQFSKQKLVLSDLVRSGELFEDLRASAVFKEGVEFSIVPQVSGSTNKTLAEMFDCNTNRLVFKEEAELYAVPSTLIAAAAALYMDYNLRTGGQVRPASYDAVTGARQMALGDPLKGCTVRASDNLIRLTKVGLDFCGYSPFTKLYNLGCAGSRKNYNIA